MAGAREVVVKIIGDNSSLNRALSESDSKMSSFGSTVTKVGGILAGGFVATQAIDFLNDSAKAAAEDAKEQTILAQVLTNVTGATKSQVEANERWITATQNATGIMDSQLRPALQNLVVATGSISEAQREMGVAMDIATAKGLDLETVTKAMAKAHDGNTGALARLGIETKNTAGETLSYDEILQNANATMGGATAAAADTASGKLAIMHAKFADMQEEIGTAVIPIMEKLVGFMSDHVLPVMTDFINFLTGAPSDIGDSVARIVNDVGNAFAAATNVLVKVANEAIRFAAFLNPFGGAGVDYLPEVKFDPVVLGPKSFLDNASQSQLDAFAKYVTAQAYSEHLVAGPAMPVPKPAPQPGQPGFVGPTVPQAPKPGQSGFIGPVPQAASGGYVAESGLAVIHKGETVTPAGWGAGAGMNVYLTVNALDPATAGQVVVKALNDWGRANNGVRVAGGVVAV